MLITHFDTTVLCFAWHKHVAIDAGIRVRIVWASPFVGIVWFWTAVSYPPRNSAKKAFTSRFMNYLEYLLIITCYKSIVVSNRANLPFLKSFHHDSPINGLILGKLHHKLCFLASEFLAFPLIFPRFPGKKIFWIIIFPLRWPWTYPIYQGMPGVTPLFSLETKQSAAFRPRPGGDNSKNLRGEVEPYSRTQGGCLWWINNPWYIYICTWPTE